MEVAGIVLGGIPLIVWALENYRLALNPAKDYWRYDSTLRDIKMHIFIQQEQLNVTLSNLGLQSASLTQVELYLRLRYPDKCDTFMTILGHMDKIVQKLMDKLDIDTKGKPKWEEVTPGRVEWEWRRIRRSFGRHARQSLIDELQYWNTALKNCFERQEIPSDEGNRMVLEMQALFDQKQCDAVRENARAIHEAVKSGWGCACPQPHGSNLYLEWHNGKLLTPAVFNLALSYRKPPKELSCASNECWQKILVRIEEATLSAPAYLTPLAAVDEPAGRSPLPAKRTRFEQLLGFGQTKTKSDAKSVRSGHSASSSQTSFASTIALPPPRPPTPPPISGLCELLQNCTTTSDCLGYFPDPESSPSRRIKIHNTAAKPSFPKMIPISSLLLPSDQQVPYQQTLSRKQRFEIAASLVWAVLLLCDSPWLSEKLDKDEIQLILDDGGAKTQREPVKNICVYHRFCPQAVVPTPSVPLSAAEQFQDCQIRNKTLFALGILLIELCLNRSFADLRSENRKYSQALDGTRTRNEAATATASEDFALAEMQTDKVYLEAGNLYGYAVQRCLRCEFPGRDVMKDFKFQQFRTNFFTGVVAPIQATFASIPDSYAAF